VVRYAFGLGGKGIPAEAQLHLAQCERCGQFFRELETWREKVAVLFPVPAVEQASPGAVERTVDKALEVVGQIRQQAVDGGVQLKQHATATYYRAVDPTPISGMRPGATTAAIATCLGLVGGATYCVETSMDPIEGLVGLVEQQPAQRDPVPPAPETQPTDPPQPPATPPVTPEPSPQPVEQSPPTPPPVEEPPPPPQPPPPPPPEPTPPPVQFGEPASAPAPTIQPTPQASTAAPAEPAPAPTGGSDLYGP
jgi:hypothetical protein